MKRTSLWSYVSTFLLLSTDKQQETAIMWQNESIEWGREVHRNFTSIEQYCWRNLSKKKKKYVHIHNKNHNNEQVNVRDT